MVYQSHHREFKFRPSTLLKQSLATYKYAHVQVLIYMITLSLFIVHWLSLFSVENTSNDIISLKLQVPMKLGSALSGKTNYPITIHSKIKEWWWQLLPKMEQFTFCKMGVSMIWKFSLVISLMIRLNLLKYSYIICLEVQRFFSPFVARQFPAIILNLSTLLLSIFTKLCWQQNIHIHFIQRIITKNNQLPKCPRNVIIVLKMRRPYRAPTLWELVTFVWGLRDIMS